MEALRYAVVGDIHSSKKDLTIVLADISKKAPDAELIGTGDLYECTVSKKDITDVKYSRLEDVMLIEEGLSELLTFPSVSGNQEERILLITKTKDPRRVAMSALPETILIGDAQIIHGHQWKWGGEPWSLIHANTEYPLTFFGHSHQSALTINGNEVTIEFGVSYDVSGENVLVNVGAVVYDKEWVLYDSVKKTVTFNQQ